MGVSIPPVTLVFVKGEGAGNLKRSDVGVLHAELMALLCSVMRQVGPCTIRAG